MMLREAREQITKPIGGRKKLGVVGPIRSSVKLYYQPYRPL